MTSPDPLREMLRSLGRTLTDAASMITAYLVASEPPPPPPPPPGPEVWTPGTLPADLVLTKTLVQRGEYTLDLYAEFTEATVTPVRVSVRARRPGGAEEHAQDDAAISRWAGGYPPSIQGSIIALKPDEDWEVLWRFLLSDGTVVDSVWPVLRTKPPFVLPDPAQLVPTASWRYVSATGDDTQAGTLAAPWKTWQRGIKGTPAGGTMVPLPGWYESTANGVGSLGARDGALSILAHGAVRVEPPHRTSPIGSTNKNPGVWVRTTVAGPGRFGTPGGRAYSLWQWVGAGFSALTGTATYRTLRDGVPQRLAFHTRDADYLATPGGFAEYLYTNGRHRYGAWASPAGDLYVRVPADQEGPDPLDPGLGPNGLYLTFGDPNSYGLYTKSGGPDRVSGVTFIGFDRGVGMGHAGMIVDHCAMQSCHLGAYANGDDGYVVDTLISDTNLAALVPDHRTIDWGAIKLAGIMADGSLYGSKICGQAEGSALRINTGRGMTFARNQVEGTFNGVNTTGGVSTTSRLYGAFTHVYDSTFRLVADDCLEPEQVALCFSAWNIRTEHCLSTLSTGPVHGGPVSLWFIEMFRNGATYCGRRRDGMVETSGKVFSKFSSKSEPQAAINVYHVTAWSPDKNPNGARGPMYAGDSAGGVTPTGLKVHELHRWMGHLVLVDGPIIDEIEEVTPVVPTIREWEEDYNVYCSLSGGLKARTILYDGSAGKAMADYRRLVGQGEHSNRVGGRTYEFAGPLALDTRALIEASLPQAAEGILALAPGSPLRGLVPPTPPTARLGRSVYDLGATP